MQLQIAINIIYHVIRTAVIRWLLADKKSVVSIYKVWNFIYILQHVMEEHTCASIFDGTQSPVEELCLRRKTAAGLFCNVEAMQAIVILSIRGITLMSSSFELTSSGLGYHQAQTPSLKKGLK